MTGLFIFVILLIIGGTVIFGIRELSDRRWFAEHGERAEAEIIDVGVRRNTNLSTGANGMTTMSSSRRFVPTVRFTTPDGQVVETQTKTTGRRPGAIGDRVQVAYDPAEPERARIV